MNTDKTPLENEIQPSCLGAVRRSYTYEEAKQIYLEGLGIAKAVFYGSLDKAEKFEEMLERMNLLYDK